MVKIIFPVIVLIGAVALFVIYKDSIFGAFGEASKGISNFTNETGKGITDFFNGFGNWGRNSNDGINPDPSKQTPEEQKKIFGKELTDDEELIINFKENSSGLSGSDKKKAQTLLDEQLANDPQLNDITLFNPPDTVGFGIPNLNDGKGIPDTPNNRKIIQEFDDVGKPDDFDFSPVSDIVDGLSDVADGLGDVFKTVTDGLGDIGVQEAFAEESIPDTQAGKRENQIVQSDIKGRQFNGGGLSFQGGMIRKAKFDEPTLRSRRQESDKIKEVRRRANEIKEKAIRDLESRQQKSNSKDSELLRKANESNKKSQGRHFGKTPEQIALELTGGSINNF